MLIARIIVSFLYSVLILAALWAQHKKSQKLDPLMALGPILLMVANFTPHMVSLFLAAAGLLDIHAAALINGKNNGKINPSHHIARLLVSIVIFVLFWFS